MLALQSADHRGFTRIGWGGRVADRTATANAASLFPPLTSVGGIQTFVFGESSVPLSVPPNPYFNLTWSGPGRFQFDALRDATLREILSQEHTNVYEVVAQLLSEEGLSASSVVAPILQSPNSVVPPVFAGLNDQVAAQFRTIAQLIEGRAQTGVKRQVFFSNVDHVAETLAVAEGDAFRSGCDLPEQRDVGGAADPIVRDGERGRPQPGCTPRPELDGRLAALLAG